jgi:hypothetical protein
MSTINRRSFLKTATLRAASLGVSGSPPLQTLAAQEPDPAYKYRIAFGAWMNDMRQQCLPLQNWPAPQFDYETVRSAINAMTGQSAAGYNFLDAWGLFATNDYPPDIVSVLGKGRRRRLTDLFNTAADLPGASWPVPEKLPTRRCSKWLNPATNREASRPTKNW